MTTAIVSMNAVVSHWPVLAVMPRSDMSGASATLIVVSLRITTNAETRSSAMTRKSSRGSLSATRGALPDGASATGASATGASVTAPSGSGGAEVSGEGEAVTVFSARVGRRRSGSWPAEGRAAAARQHGGRAHEARDDGVGGGRGPRGGASRPGRPRGLRHEDPYPVRPFAILRYSRTR